MWQGSFVLGTTAWSPQRTWTVPVPEPRPRRCVTPPYAMQPVYSRRSLLLRTHSQKLYGGDKALATPLQNRRRDPPVLPRAGGDGGSGRGSAGRGQRAASPQSPLGVVVRHAAPLRGAAAAGTPPPTMRRGSSPPHKQPGSPAPARRNAVNSPPPVFLYTRSSAGRAPLGSPGSLTAGHERQPHPHPLASWVGQTASHPPSAPSPLRCGCPRPLPPPPPGAAR